MAETREKTGKTAEAEKAARPRRRRTVADRAETLRFYSDVMRAALPDGEEPKIADRIRAAEALARQQETDSGLEAVLLRLDEMLQAVRDAAD